MKGEAAAIDLIGSHFWIVVMVAVLAMAPITRSNLRNGIWAAVNAGAIAFLLGVDVLALGVIVVFATWAAAWAIERAAW